jgi:precorrin-6Y C5,15-methyltransferase (decarboxylating)
VRGGAGRAGLGADGLPDEAFESDGTMTKREVRAVTLAKLAPLPGQMLWDVGLGSGSVAIEWMRAAKGARAVGVEPRADRRAIAAANALALGVPDLAIVRRGAGALAGPGRAGMRCSWARDCRRRRSARPGGR